MRYLGHMVSSQGVITDPKKISALAEWPVPQSKKTLRGFLGFCSYYRKFFKGFSLVTRPLCSLTEKQVKFDWTDQCQKAFEALKRVLTSSPILSFPSEKGEFILDTDASNHGIGAVLSQVQDKRETVIAYFSRILNKAKRNYCVARRELLAVVDSIKSFHHYLYGQKFLIRTDHASLRWLISLRNLEGRLARWLERIQQYNFEILHQKGASHGNTDGLSRRPCIESPCNYCTKVELRKYSEDMVGRISLRENESLDWRKSQLEDSVLCFF